MDLELGTKGELFILFILLHIIIIAQWIAPLITFNLSINLSFLPSIHPSSHLLSIISYPLLYSFLSITFSRNNHSNMFIRIILYLFLEMCRVVEKACIFNLPKMYGLEISIWSLLGFYLLSYVSKIHSCFFLSFFNFILL